MADADVMIGRLERNARLAADAAKRERDQGQGWRAAELEGFADLFKLSAQVIRKLRHAAELERTAPSLGEPR